MKKYKNMPIDDMDNMTVPEQLRTSKGLTQEQLAEVLDIDVRTYRKLEKDLNGTIENLTKLAAYWKVSCDYLLGNEHIQIKGLSPKAIKTLEWLKLYDTANGDTTDFLPLLNKLLSSHRYTWDILHQLDILINLNGTLALHKDGKDIIPDDQQEHSFRLLHDKDTSAFTAINVKSLIRADTYDKIKNTLSDFIKKEQKRG